MVLECTVVAVYAKPPISFKQNCKITMEFPEFERKHTMISYRIFKKHTLNLYCEDDDDNDDDELVDYKGALRSCIVKNNNDDLVVNASKLQKVLFQQVGVEGTIFISHLHADVNKAQRIKYVLSQSLPQYKCFIDSEIWSDVYDVIKELKDKYAKTPEGNVYKSSICMNITKNLLLMVAMSLTEVISKSSAFIYISGGENRSGNSIATDSPWVCHELLVSSLIPEAPDVSRLLLENFSKKASCSAAIFKYEVPSKHLRYGSLNEFIKIMKH